MTVKKSGNKSNSISYIVALPSTIIEAWGIVASSSKEERKINMEYDSDNNRLILSPATPKY
ncbi:MAG: hypothetical protein Q4P17_10505 [Methanobacterium sp.]|nr:hypothetical protein [Methanobacterium sp.]